MTFLAPLWIMLGAAAAVPLLLHLMRRRSGVRTDFPAARYLLRAEREHSRSLRLRNLLLMLLRMAVVLLLALAAARPAASWLGGAAPGHAPTALAIVVDNSLSTAVIERGRPALASLQDAARRAAAAASPDDRVFVVTVDGRVRGGGGAAAKSAIEQVGPFAGAGDLPAAVRSAAAAAAGAAGLAPRIAVFTDGQAAAWPTAIELPREVPITVAMMGAAAPPNHGVTYAVARPVRWTPRGAVELRVSGRDSATYRVALETAEGERTIARGSIAPGERTTISASAPAAGWMAGRVEIDADELPGDDVRHFALWSGAAPSVSVLPGAGPFLRNAIAVVQGNGAARAGDDVRILSADELERGGAVLVVAPAAPGRVGAANAALARRGIPWRLGAAVEGALEGTSGIAGARIRTGYALVATAPARADTLATVHGMPWAVAGESAAGRYVLIASPLLPDATDLPIRAAFVPWVASLVADRLGEGGGDVLEAGPGAAVRVPPGVDSLESTDGAVVAWAGATAPAKVGVYFLRAGGERVGALVVNAEESESVLDRLRQDDVAARIRGPRVTTLDLVRQAPEAVFATAGRRSIVAPMLLAALLLLAVEAGVTALRVRGAQ